MDDDARWCNTCTLLQDEEPADWDEVCRQCQESDENKDVVVRDTAFLRLWRAVRLKGAGIPVLELAASLDEVLAIRAIEDQIERNQLEDLEEQQERRRQQRAPGRQAGLLQIEE